MAGSPLKRAKREAEARAAQLAQQLAELGGTIPDADESAPAEPARIPVHFAPRHLRSVSRNQPPPGAAARGVTDQVNASNLAQLANVLRPYVTCSIERLKPDWAAGFVESEYQLEAGTVPELISYLRSEWGGDVYRVSVLHTNGAVAFETRIRVAGPPKEAGRVMERYPSAPSSSAQPVATPASPTGEMLGMMEKLLTIVGGAMREQNTQASNRLEAYQRAENEKMEKLVQALVATRTVDAQATAQPSMLDQLKQFAQTHKAMTHFAEAFAPPKADNGEPEDEDMLKLAAKEAGKHFFANAIGSFFTQRSGGGAARVVSPQAPQPPNAPANTHVRVHARMPAREPVQKPGENADIADA